MTRTTNALLSLAGLLVCGLLAAQEDVGDTRRPVNDVSTHEIHRAISEISIDGVMDEPAWSEATSIPIEYEWFPGDNVPAPVRTVAYVTYDNRNLYVGFRAWDPDPSKIRAQLMDRDQIDTLVQNDYVIIQIDTFNDQRRSYQFRVNPLGVQADAYSSEVDAAEDWSWDMIWSSRGRITDDGFVVEVALPFNQLRFPNSGETQTWGFDVGRSWPRSTRHRMNASGRDWDQACWVCQFDKLTGLGDLEPGRNIELDPTLTALRTDELDAFPDGSLEEAESDVEAGITGRWGITPSLTLTGTINPDFSQVEADVAQLDINERFALYYPEKRPFFLEGVSAFNVLNRIIFTRTVVDPDWGVKLAGRTGRNNIGVFAAEDSVNTLLFPSNQSTASTLLEEPVTSAVVRYRRDVGAGGALGLVHTNRQGSDYHNRVTGVDGFFRPRETDTLMFQYVRSDTAYPDAVADAFGQPRGSFSDDLWEIRYEFTTREWNWAVDYEDYGPGFRADSGFMPRVDMRKAQAIGSHTFWGKENSWYDRWAIGAYANHIEQHGGQLTDEAVQLFANLTGPLQFYGEAYLQRRKEFFDGILYEDLNGVDVYAELQPGGAVKLSLYTRFGDAIDFANNQPADEQLVNLQLEAKLGRHVNVNFDHRMQKLDVDGGKLFEANLSQLRLVYNFNIRMLVRGIFQWLDVERAPDLYQNPVEPETRTLFTQLLFSYKVNARTVLFLGYSDNQLGLQDVSLTRTDRTLFFKVGYAWIL